MYEEILNGVEEKLKEFDCIDFSILFGSFAEEKATGMSDIDLAVYFNRELDILDLGRFISRLESFLGRTVDITTLNKLYRKDPEFAYEIITRGKVISCRNNPEFIEFKEKTLLSYIDLQPLRAMMQESLKKRIAVGKAGERNYAG